MNINKCPKCGESHNSEDLYEVSSSTPYKVLCGACAKEVIEDENWQYLNFSTLFELKSKGIIDEKLIDRKLENAVIFYCRECGHFIFPSIYEPYYGKPPENCPKCASNWSVLDWGIYKKDLEGLKFFKATRSKLEHLIEGIAWAKNFIYVVSTMIDEFFAGMLAVKAQELCDVNIIIMNSNDFLRKLVGSFHRFENKIRINRDCHQKLIIIDGILAFIGSANATFAGWTRPGEMRLSPLTIPEEIRKINEEFFVQFYRNSRILT